MIHQRICPPLNYNILMMEKELMKLATRVRPTPIRGPMGVPPAVGGSVSRGKEGKEEEMEGLATLTCILNLKNI